MRIKKYILTSSTLLAILGVLMEINLFEMLGLNFSTTEITLLLFVFTCLFFLNIKKVINEICNLIKEERLLIFLIVSSVTVLILSTLFSQLFTEALKGNLRLSIGIIFGILFSYVWKKELVYKEFIKKFLFSLVFAYAILAVLQFIYPQLNKLMTDIFAEGNLHYAVGLPRVTGTMIHPNLFGWFLLIGLVFGLNDMKLKTYIKKYPLLGLLFVSLVSLALVFVQSRNVWLVFILAMVSTIILSEIKHIKIFAFTGCVVMLVFIFLLFPARLDISPQINAVYNQMNQYTSSVFNTESNTQQMHKNNNGQKIKDNKVSQKSKSKAKNQQKKNETLHTSKHKAVNNIDNKNVLLSSDKLTIKNVKSNAILKSKKTKLSKGFITNSNVVKLDKQFGSIEYEGYNLDSGYLNLLFSANENLSSKNAFWVHVKKKEKRENLDLSFPYRIMQNHKYTLQIPISALARGTYNVEIGVWNPDKNKRLTISGFQDKSKWNSKKSRLALWKAAIKIGLTHPLTGIGRGVFKEVFPKYVVTNVNKNWLKGNKGVFQTHNIYLSWFSEFGILGFVVILSFVLYIIYKTSLLTSFKIIPIWVVIFGSGFLDDYSYFYLFVILSIMFSYIIFEQYNKQNGEEIGHETKSSNCS